jgi:NAD(P)-dependent dehydrogenase (short-subunit alcohol dehydrogenase family)
MTDFIRDKTILITGSTDGIGKQTALQLAMINSNIILHGRNSVKGRSTINEIKEKSGNENLQLFISDLSSQNQVHRLVHDLIKSHARLNVLINNAGVFMPRRALTEDGLEMTFAVNCLAPFLVANELLDILVDAAPSRIINVASIAHWNARIDWNNLQGERRYDGFEVYAASKLGIILLTYALAERLKSSEVTVNCLHPGVIKTKLLSSGFGDYPGEPPEVGARTPVYLATSSEVEGVTGKYFENCKPVQSSPLSHDQSLKQRFWKICQELTGLL